MGKKMNCCASSECSFKTIGFVIGWFGVMYRSIAAIALAVLIAFLDRDDPTLFLIAYCVILGYLLISLGANFSLIVGIKQHKRWFIFPYLTFLFGEIVVGTVLYIGGIATVCEMQMLWALYYVIPLGILGLCFYMFFWICLIKIYEEVRIIKAEETLGKVRDSTTV